MVRVGAAAAAQQPLRRVSKVRPGWPAAAARRVGTDRVAVLLVVVEDAGRALQRAVGGRLELRARGGPPVIVFLVAQIDQRIDRQAAGAAGERCQQPGGRSRDAAWQVNDWHVGVLASSTESFSVVVVALTPPMMYLKSKRREVVGQD